MLEWCIEPLFEGHRMICNSYNLFERIRYLNCILFNKAIYSSLDNLSLLIMVLGEY